MTSSHWHQCPLCHHTWGCRCEVRPAAGARPPQPLCPRCLVTMAQAGTDAPAPAADTTRAPGAGEVGAS